MTERIPPGMEVQESQPTMASMKMIAGLASEPQTSNKGMAALAISYVS